VKTQFVFALGLAVAAFGASAPAQAAPEGAMEKAGCLACHTK
jgi:hypothetical protein